MEDSDSPIIFPTSPLRNNTPTLMTERIANQSPLLVPYFTLFWQPVRKPKPTSSMILIAASGSG